MGRILGLDYGRRRIGLAMSDPLQCIALPFETWENTSIDHILQKLSTLVSSHDIQILVVGLPITLKGERKKLAKEVERFCNHIKQKLDVPIVLWDERLTSVQAKRALIELNEKPSRNKGKIDRIAAVFILQNYMDAHPKNLTTNKEEID
ncbi:Holliday junction resolvase RuvX [bacterium]